MTPTYNTTHLENAGEGLPAGMKPAELPDFENTEIAFAYKSNKQLKKSAWLFNLMSKPWLVDLGSKLAIPTLRMRVPFAEGIVRSTLFEQFCGGATLLEAQKSIDQIGYFGVDTILDYGVEAKESEEDFNKTMNEVLRSIEFAALNENAAVVSTKITGMARFEFLEILHSGEPLTKEYMLEYKNVMKRLDTICNIASHRSVAVYFDAEESWIQDGIDKMINILMARYNKEKPIVYNTFQLYLHNRLQFLFESYNKAQKEGYILGAKLVRGAYMEKERDRAKQKGYPSPVHETKQDTDDAYNAALKFCIGRHDQIATVVATHNIESTRLMAELADENNIPRNHGHLHFGQLYGMSDNLTFNLAKAGFNALKLVPYGPVRDVVPYLLRRAQENTSVTGDVGRELKLLTKEIRRRGL